MIKRLFLLAIAVLTMSYVFAQKPAGYDQMKVYQPVQLKADFSYFRNLLEKIHPSLYRYISKDSLDHQFNLAYARLNEPMNELDFWKLMQSIVVKVNSGHTSLALSNYNRVAMSRAHQMYPPFYVAIRDDHLFVRNYVIAGCDSSLYNIGDEIIAINGEPALNILTNIRKLIAGDGFDNDFKDMLIEDNAFFTYYNFNHDLSKTFTVDFKSNAGIKQVSLRPVFFRSDSLRHPDSIITKKPDYDNIRSLAFPADVPSTAILTLRNFTYTDYVDFDNKVFKQILEKDVKNLVIDIRGNTGGTDQCCIDLLRYLIRKEFLYLFIQEGQVNVNAFMEKNKAATKSNGMINVDSVKEEPYQVRFHNRLELPYFRTFKGNIYLLTNGMTFSAAALFAVALKAQRECTVLGRRTGGGLAGTDGGQLPTVVLPQTGMTLHLPLYWGKSAAGNVNHGHGMDPDIEIIPAPFDMYQHKDAVLLKVKQLIRATSVTKSE